MREITVDFGLYGDRKSLHKALKEKFGFEEWYGANLDALHDMLTEPCEKTKVRLIVPDDPADGMTEYISKVVSVFLDSAVENKSLKLEIV